MGTALPVALNRACGVHRFATPFRPQEIAHVNPQSLNCVRGALFKSDKTAKMASRPRAAAAGGAGHDQQGGGLVGEDRVQDILSICPATMGSGLESLLAETDNSGRLRVKAVGRIKVLLVQVKQSIKVSGGGHVQHERGDSEGARWCVCVCVRGLGSVCCCSR